MTQAEIYAWTATIRGCLAFFIAPVVIVTLIRSVLRKINDRRSIIRNSHIFRKFWLPPLIALGIAAGFIGVLALTVVVFLQDRAGGFHDIVRMYLAIAGVGFVPTAFGLYYFGAAYYTGAFIGILSFNLLEIGMSQGMKYFLGIHLSEPREGNTGALVLYGILLLSILLGFIVGIFLELMMRIRKERKRRASC